MSATTKTAPDLRAVLQQALETLDHDPVSLAEVAAWIPRKVVAIAAIRAALEAPAAASGAGTHWTYRRYGSEPQKGYNIVALPHQGATHGEFIANLGDGDAAGKAAEALCEAHNAALSAARAAAQPVAEVTGGPTHGMLLSHALPTGTLLYAHAPAAAPDLGDELHGRIMNLPCRVPTHDGVPYTFDSAYKLGHRDARHAAAELVGEVQAAAPVAPAAAQAQPESCRWTHEPDMGIWHTDCGHAWQFEAGGPGEDGIGFCMYCGQPIDVIEGHDDEAGAAGATGEQQHG